MDEVLADFEKIKQIDYANQRQALIEEWMELSSQYNAKLYEALTDESKLDAAAIIKEDMNEKQAEIDAIGSGSSA
jgi:hypothetical protein